MLGPEYMILDKNYLQHAQILGYLKIINFPFVTNGKLLISGVPIFKQITVI